MNRLVRGSILVAVAGGIWACGGNPFDENLDAVASIKATPQIVFVSNVDSEAVVVEALNDIGNQNAADFTISNVVGNFTVTQDTTFGEVIDGENLKTRARFFVKPNTTNTFEAGSFDVSASGKMTTVSVSVTPSQIFGLALSNPNPALGDTVTVQLPAGLKITDSTTLSFADPSQFAFIVGASADSSLVSIVVGPGINDGAITFNKLGTTYIPSNKFTVTTSATVTTDSLPAVISNTTPAGGVPITVSIPGFKFAPDSEVHVAVAGADGLVLSVSPDSNTITFLPTPAISGNIDFDGVIYLAAPDAGQVSVRTIPSITPGAPPFPGSDDVATAPTLPVPAPGNSITFYDPGTFTGAAPAVGGPDQMYTFTVASTTTLTLTLDWTNDSDVDILWLNSTGTGFINCFGGATGAQPETDTCTFAAGTYLLSLNLFSGEVPGWLIFDLSTQ